MTVNRRPSPFGLPATPAPDPPQWLRHAGHRLRFAARVAGLVLWTLPSCAVQAVCLWLPGEPKRRFARIYWAGVCRIMGIERRVAGTPVGRSARPVLFVSNHTSWLDIPTLGGTLEACFVAKAEVGRWPVVRTVARLGRTVFVSRRASETGRERDGMRGRLAAGDDLILFPEGTSSDGTRVLAFRTSFFSVAEGADPPLIQPVSIVYDRLDGLPMGRTTRPVSSWYGDMDLGGHFWRLARYRRLRATIVLHEPIDPARYPTRKALATSVWGVVASGAAGLRQNRERAPATFVSLDSKAAITGTVTAR